jgi:hypothetical protein
VLKVQQ